MFIKNYHTTETQTFDIADYPQVANEARQLSVHLRDTPCDFKQQVLLKFLRDHSIGVEWAQCNKVLAGLLLSGTLTTTHIESLFESCRSNKEFTHSFETYLVQTFE